MERAKHELDEGDATIAILLSTVLEVESYRFRNFSNQFR
jgi:hypothetical protein